MIDNILKELNETIEKHRNYFLNKTLEQRLELYHQEFDGIDIDNYNPEQGLLKRCDDAEKEQIKKENRAYIKKPNVIKLVDEAVARILNIDELKLQAKFKKALKNVLSKVKANIGIYMIEELNIMLINTKLIVDVVADENGDYGDPLINRKLQHQGIIFSLDKLLNLGDYYKALNRERYTDVMFDLGDFFEDSAFLSEMCSAIMLKNLALAVLDSGMVNQLNTLPSLKPIELWLGDDQMNKFFKIEPS